MAERQKLSDKSIIILIPVVSSIIAIFVFITGYENLPQLWQKINSIIQSFYRYYDNFDNSAFDGKYNETLWKFEGIKGFEARQEKGVMTFTAQSIPESGNNALVPIKPHSWTYEQLSLMEAKLKLDSSRRGRGSFLKIQAVALIKEDYGWWMECQLKNDQTEHTLYFCNIYSGQGWNADIGYEYQTEFIEGAYDTWYTTRFEVDSKTAECRFFLNDKLIGKYIPRDAERLKTVNLFPQIGSWTNPGESFIGYVDDVRIGQ